MLPTSLPLQWDKSIIEAFTLPNSEPTKVSSTTVNRLQPISFNWNMGKLLMAMWRHESCEGWVLSKNTSSFSEIAPSNITSYKLTFLSRPVFNCFNVVEWCSCIIGAILLQQKWDSTKRKRSHRTNIVLSAQSN